MPNHAHEPSKRAMVHEKRVSLAELNCFPDVEPDKVTPTSLTIDVTHCCPFRCEGCIEGEAMTFSAHTALRAETACRLISQFAEQDGKEVLLYGGEPTAHPHFDAVVRHAADSVGLVRVVTNGALLEQRHIAEALWLAAERAEVSVRVSLNAGAASTHEALHRARGYFRRVVNGMKLLNTASSPLRLGVSFLLEEANAREILQAYDIAGEVGATDFWLRPKTGLHGIGLIPLSPNARKAALEAVGRLSQQPITVTPNFHVEPWFVRFLKSNSPPETAKAYPACYYCAASRLVISPPEPGVVWACTYWRANARFHVANLSEVSFNSSEFERCRIAAIQRVYPPRDCAGVICDRNKANQAIWEKLGWYSPDINHDGVNTHENHQTKRQGYPHVL